MAIVLITFWLVSAVAIGLAAAVKLLQPRLPQFFNDLLLYGKIVDSRRDKTIVQYIEIPKRWFLHFYIIGTIANGAALIVFTRAYFGGVKPFALLPHVLDLLSFHDTRSVSIEASSAILLIAMMFAQNCRRLYECLFVSVYSSGTMNLLHYILGILVYSTFHLTVLSEAPSLLSTKTYPEDLLQWRHLIGLALFLWASWHHNQVHTQFANLRKDKRGVVVTAQHKLPHGGWFDYISCPHYFMEILIYVAMMVVAGAPHWTLASLVFFVLTNQVAAGMLTHHWYRKTFKELPRQRKAVIPFLI